MWMDDFEVSSFCGEFFRLIALSSRLWLIFMYYLNFTVIFIFALLPIYLRIIIFYFFVICHSGALGGSLDDVCTISWLLFLHCGCMCLLGCGRTAERPDVNVFKCLVSCPLHFSRILLSSDKTTQSVICLVCWTLSFHFIQMCWKTGTEPTWCPSTVVSLTGRGCS